eukprot:gene13433-18011_t
MTTEQQSCEIIGYSIPRSKAESIYISCSKNLKQLQLPCRTFIAVGCCPYGEKCAYLHFDWCVSNSFHRNAKGKNKEMIVSDSFFWPPISSTPIEGFSTYNGRTGYYSVPLPQKSEPDYYLHDRGLYSLWSHFYYQSILFSSLSPYQTNNRFYNQYKSHETILNILRFQSSKSKLNMFTHDSRLECFIYLSQGQSISTSCKFDD